MGIQVRDIESLRRIESRGSIKSKVSRVFSAVSGRGRARDGGGIRHEPLPQTNLDEGIVGWEGQDDPQMPLNFPPFRKWLLVGLLSTITLVTPFASSILSPGISSLMVEFGESQQIVGSMTVSIYLLGYVVGPMVMAPMSEIYGRRPVLTAANLFFCCWQIGCALAPDISSLIVFRFFSGVGGAGCLTLGGAVIGDLFRPEQRGFAMGIWTFGPLIGKHKPSDAFASVRHARMQQQLKEMTNKCCNRPHPRSSDWGVHRRIHRMALRFLDRARCRRAHLYHH